MRWRLSHRADPVANRIAKRHYNCQSPNSAQFVKPGSCLVLLAGPALWVSSAPYARFVKHAWAGAWECSTFRNEGALIGSELIREAVAATLHHYGEPPALGMITFINPRRVTGYFVRTTRGRELRWGYSFWKAGFEFCGWTKGGLYAMQMLPSAMPAPAPPRGSQSSLLEVA